MFFQPPEEESQNSQNLIKPPSKNLRRKRKKNISKQNKQAKKKEASHRKQFRLATTMSHWAESYTSAAIWQIKHQVAYWKSRAKALEYENKVLHGIIKDNYMNPIHSNFSLVCNSSTTEMKTENDEESDQEEHEEEEPEENDNFEEHEEEELEENDNFEVSEEFIQFLTENAKYKEDARKERERIKAEESKDAEVEELEAGPSESHENRQEILKELYGDKWQKICALETSIHSEFINNCDCDKPLYWPNIPFNFTFR